MRGQTYHFQNVGQREAEEKEEEEEEEEEEEVEEVKFCPTNSQRTLESITTFDLHKEDFKKSYKFIFLTAQNILTFVSLPSRSICCLTLIIITLCNNNKNTLCRL